MHDRPFTPVESLWFLENLPFRSGFRFAGSPSRVRVAGLRAHRIGAPGDQYH
jgi:hypothetical protein